MRKNMSKRGLAKLLAGLGLGVGVGMLVSPKSGKENREELKKIFDELVDKVKAMDPEDVKDQVVTKVDELKKELSELDKEKVMSIAKKKGNQLKKKADELVEYAKEKGTPVIEGIAEDAREKTIAVVKDVLAKLEKED